VGLDVHGGHVVLEHAVVHDDGHDVRYGEVEAVPDLPQEQAVEGGLLLPVPLRHLPRLPHLLLVDVQGLGDGLGDHVVHQLDDGVLLLEPGQLHVLDLVGGGVLVDLRQEALHRVLGPLRHRREVVVLDLVVVVLHLVQQGGGDQRHQGVLHALLPERGVDLLQGVGLHHGRVAEQRRGVLQLDLVYPLVLQQDGPRS